MCRLYALLILTFLVAPVGLKAQGKKPLTDADVIQMVKAGFNQQTIIGAIKANDAAFDTSVQALLQLKNAGVSQSVIDVMLSAEARKRPVEQLQTQTVSQPVAVGAASGGTPNPLLQQADDLDRQANDADAKAQELEQKANRSGGGLGGFFALKSSIEAKHLRDKASKYRQEAEQLRAQAGVSSGSWHGSQTGTTATAPSPAATQGALGSQSLAAVPGFQTFENYWCTLMYPQDWKLKSAQGSVVLSPEAQPPQYGAVELHPPHFGAYIFATKLAGKGYNHLTKLDFSALIAHLQSENAQGMLTATQLTHTTALTINGQPAQAAEFTGSTNERDWFIAILAPGTAFLGEDLLCIQFFAPAKEFEADRPLFQRIANSIVVKPMK
jgi:hypothetical protein